MNKIYTLILATPLEYIILLEVYIIFCLNYIDRKGLEWGQQIGLLVSLFITCKA